MEAGQSNWFCYPAARTKMRDGWLGKLIQEGEHNSTEDAKATMELYRVVKDEWEDDVCMGKYSFFCKPEHTYIHSWEIELYTASQVSKYYIHALHTGYMQLVLLPCSTYREVGWLGRRS